MKKYNNKNKKQKTNNQQQQTNKTTHMVIVHVGHSLLTSEPDSEKVQQQK